MADYARMGDSARAARGMAEQVRRLRTRRPVRGGSPTIAVALPAPLLEGQTFPWVPVVIDPGGVGEYPEYKQLIAFEGTGDSGSIGVFWYYKDAVTDPPVLLNATSHVIGSGLTDNRVDLSVPLVMPADATFAWVRPVIDFATDVAYGDIYTAALVFEIVPV